MPFHSGSSIIKKLSENIKLLSKEREYQLALTFSSETSTLKEKQEARNELILANLRLIGLVLKKYTNYFYTEESQEEMIQDGIVGLIKAADKFDPHIGKFSTYAIWWIRQSVLNGIKRRGHRFKVPAQMYEQVSLFNKIKETANVKNLSEEDLANCLNIKKSKVQELKILSQSLKSTISEDDQEFNTIPDIKSSENIQNKLEYLDLYRSFEKHLTTREKTVLASRFGFNKDYQEFTLCQTASLMKLSSERVRQIEKQAILKLKEALA